ncbi:hypothetical protein BscR1v2_010630 [Bartonella schoenbuchensis R1]|uniref:Uncharacterized protein n=1 Tax=Bartonella schoenbuchensis (strain DSM 13525 / NCTC 13165 / R1) TaxID=687861 RepID=A0A1S6XQT5_BARSR|nr:hypothetical protein BscR1v2_002340 [Bartonella schoenbuchensis R1]AQX30989.1 hypothetical protein BscR1v2_010630 [Bartonella schoenbuchensis R1]
MKFIKQLLAKNLDKIKEMRLCANQVLEKHLQCIAD